MIYTEERLKEGLMAAASLYRQYAGTTLVFVHSRSKRETPAFTEIYFGAENFMHLVGIKSGTLSARAFYEACLNGTVAAADCTPRHSFANRNEKIRIFPDLFDFSKSKLYKIGDRDLSTELDDFVLATGNQNGTVGYDHRNPENPFPFPVTLLGYPLSYYCSKPDKIIAVVQKTRSGNRLIYEIKEGVFAQYQSQMT